MLGVQELQRASSTAQADGTALTGMEASALTGAALHIQMVLRLLIYIVRADGTVHHGMGAPAVDGIV